MLYVMEPSDNVQLEILKPGAKIDSTNKYPTYIQKMPYAISFSGKGAAKLECRWEIEKASGNIIMSSSGASVPSIFSKLYSKNLSVSENIEKTLLALDSLKQSSLYEQLSYKNKVSQIAFYVERLNIITHFDYSKLYFYSKSYWLANIKQQDSTLRELKSLYSNQMVEEKNSDSTTPYFKYSPLYWNYSVDKKLQESKFNVSDFKIVDLYSQLKTHDNRQRREFLTTNYLIFWYGQGGFPGIDSIANLTLQSMQDAELKNSLSPFVKFAKGSAAYAFNLPDNQSTYHKLDNMKGKVVFMDFWYTGCGACISYYKNTLKETEAQFANNDSVVFVTVSIDKNPEYWKKSLSLGLYTGEHAVNLYTDGQGNEHPIIKFYKILGYPAPILIDKQGRIFAKGQELRSAEGLRKNIEMALKE